MPIECVFGLGVKTFVSFVEHTSSLALYKASVSIPGECKKSFSNVLQHA